MALSAMLSVITITYADPIGLASTVDSLRTLARGDWEHIVVDSSPEGNRDVISGLPIDWPLVHVVAPPRGIYAAMNSGIAAAHGDVLWFLNGGDRLADAESLKRARELLDQDPGVDILACGVWLTRRGKRLAGPRGVCVPESDFTKGKNPHQGMLYRKRVFDVVGLYDDTYRIFGDYAHHWRCVLGGVRSKTSDLMIADFDIDGINATGHAIWKLEMARFNTWLKPRISPDRYREHLQLMRWWSARRIVGQVGSRVPRLRALLRPAWRFVLTRAREGRRRGMAS
jgi:glycosyltransferase involved in cell wall biosynthesis